MKTVEFYFDFLSPYSYLAWLEHKKIKDVQWIYKPVVMGNLFKHFEIKGPAEVLPKREFLFRQLLRKTKKEGIPFFTPAAHPFNPLYALRVASLAAAGEEQYKVIDALWNSGWGRPGKSTNLGNPDELTNVLNEAGLDGSALIDKVSDREVRAEIKNNNKGAIEKGIFGVPTFRLDDEIFWGSDSINELQDCLSDEDFLDRSLYLELLEKIPKGI